MRSFLLLLLLGTFTPRQGYCQTTFPLSGDADTVTTLILDLTNKESLDAALKKIHQMKSVRSVELRGKCDTETMSRILYRLSVLWNLGHLAFTENELTEIPDNLKNLKSLYSVAVSGNESLNYRKLFQLLNDMQTVTHLELSDNDLKAIPAEVSAITHLSSVKISRNERMDYVDLVEKLSRLPSLRKLAIPVNFITELPGNITRLTKLEVLDVSNNVLDEFPAGMSSLKELNNLSIYGNIIINQVRELEKFKGSKIRYLAIDKELTGDEMEQIRKFFPGAEISFPQPNGEISGDSVSTASQRPPLKKRGTLSAKRDFRILSNAYLLYPALFGNIVYTFDTLQFDERYADTSYLSTGRITGRIMFASPDRRRPSAAQIVNLFLHQKCNHRNPGRRNEIWFHLPHNNYVSLEHAELSAFGGMYWVYKGPLSKKEFRKKFMNTRKEKWTDIRILFNEEAKMFTIELKSQRGFVQFTAVPVSSKKSTSENDQKTYNKRYAAYTKMLLRRANKFKKDYIRNKKTYDENFRKLMDYAWSELRSRMSDEEKQMTRDEWLEYYDQVISNEKVALDNAPVSGDNLLRSLTVSDFINGNSFNDSSFWAYRNSLRWYRSHFTDEKGKRLAVARAIVIDTRNRYMWQVQGTLGITEITLPLKQYGSFVVLLELRNGDVALVSSGEIDKGLLSRNGISTLKTRIFDKNLDTIGKIRREAGLQ